ncbi:hypothetical protein BB559_006956 [Furculomyces boomerangus]|uniref:RNA helicase n=1 Tax=Furculomyces boomerangus TaxID=61424 RepID=A0A2T9XZQ3_9FUNG|nr:hypothetical protein BB559_006956 [Furculomyces boomerangus]
MALINLNGNTSKSSTKVRNGNDKLSHPNKSNDYSSSTFNDGQNLSSEKNIQFNPNSSSISSGLKREYGSDHNLNSSSLTSENPEISSQLRKKYKHDSNNLQDYDTFGSPRTLEMSSDGSDSFAKVNSPRGNSGDYSVDLKKSDDSNSLQTDSSKIDADIKAQKRREKLELWKKTRKSTENDTLKSSSNNNVEPVVEDKAKLRRLKLASFMEKKNLSDNKTLGDNQRISSLTGTNGAFQSSNDKNLSSPLNSSFGMSTFQSSKQGPTLPKEKTSLKPLTKIVFGSNLGTKAKTLKNGTNPFTSLFKKPEDSKPKNKSAFKFEYNEISKSPLPLSMNNLESTPNVAKSLPDSNSQKNKQILSAEKSEDTIGDGVLNFNSESPNIIVGRNSAETKDANNHIAGSMSDDVDSLDAFMESVSGSLSSESRDGLSNGVISGKIGLFDSEYNQEDKEFGDNKIDQAGMVDTEDGIVEDSESILELAAKRMKKKDVITVDHSKVEYEPFRKSFYVEPAELRNMKEEELEELRFSLDGIKIRGQNCPIPAVKWTYFGLPLSTLQIIKKQEFEKPTPIQAQAIPAILQGRDVIGVASTGSGKTLAFVLPMIRHIKAQRPLEAMEGPIAMVMTPTRELAVQIARECRIFTKNLGIRTMCAYGGSPIKDQIAELKRGAEIVVCTPGRMIDLLTANSGRVTNLKRVTYLVLDEADRMFDMGFEPQVMKIVQNVRPTHQTLLFSATFPRQMEALARKVLKKPLEITVGGRSVVCSDIEQRVEVVEFDEKFVKLLSVLGNEFNENADACALVFVERQESADNLFKDLLKRGYVCNSLHGGKEQIDRDQTILDFKQGVFNLLIATSVAARGLDVKRLSLVVNYDCPNHLEDYVHRVGRTGRAGNKGSAVTFITKDQGRYAIEIIKSLQSSGVSVPPEVQALADDFLEDVRMGNIKYYNEHSSGGFGGKGLEKLDVEREAIKKIQRFTFGVEEDQEVEDDRANSDNEVDASVTVEEKSKPDENAKDKNKLIVKEAIEKIKKNNQSTQIGSIINNLGDGTNNGISLPVLAAIKAAQKAAEKLAGGSASNVSSQAILSAVDKVNAQLGFVQGSQTVSANDDIHAAQFFAEIEINDYPQRARWRVTNRETLAQITETTGAAITVRGIFIQPGKPFTMSSGAPKNLITAGGELSSLLSSSFSSELSHSPASNAVTIESVKERKLYLRIECNSEVGVERAKAEIKRILAEATLLSIEMESRQGTIGGQTFSRYSVV